MHPGSCRRPLRSQCCYKSGLDDPRTRGTQPTSGGGGGEARGGSHRGCQASREESRHVEANVPLPAPGAWRGATSTRKTGWGG